MPPETDSTRPSPGRGDGEGPGLSDRGAPRRFERPVFLVAPPRSGARLLLSALARSPEAWSPEEGGPARIEAALALPAEARGWSSDRLTGEDATPAALERLTDALFLSLRNGTGERPAAGAEGLRLVWRGPRNALRVPFLARGFPDALFVYFYRHPREAINALFESWSSGRAVTHPALPGWPGPPWSHLLVPGWRELTGRGLPEIAARQWEISTGRLLDDLEALAPERWCLSSYGHLATDPEGELGRLRAFLGLERGGLPPAAEDAGGHGERGGWRRNAALLESVFPLVAPTARRALDLFASRPGHPPLAEGVGEEAPGDGEPSGLAAASAGARSPSSGPSPLRSVSTVSFPHLLRALGSSLLVSTYQSGRVILVRAPPEDPLPGETPPLNTHFRSYPSPMGIAVGQGVLALGTAREVWELRNVPAAAPRLEPADRHDACFLPRACHVTGDIRVHDLAYAGGELWAVNTRFSCLCVLDREHSFVPRWRPPFVSALAPEDRCHLNGLAVVEGEPRYVTALGRSDTPQGWRETKGTGGLLLEVPSGEAVAAGLSMPHSPRWHDGKLWVLESGKGEIGVVDLASGRVEPVARLPGFTRGLSFAGPYAFVGLSQVRESVFGGLPLTRRLLARACGVWAVDTRSGAVAAFLRFEDAVQEIFEVALLAGFRFPELCEPGDDLLASTYVLPDAALAEVAFPARRGPS